MDLTFGLDIGPKLKYWFEILKSLKCVFVFGGNLRYWLQCELEATLVPLMLIFFIPWI